MLASVGVFFASVSLSPLDKEMKCRHAQWLMRLSKKLQHITRSGSSRTAQTSSASDPPCHRNEVPPRTVANETKQETPTYNPLRLKQNRPEPQAPPTPLSHNQTPRQLLPRSQQPMN